MTQNVEYQILDQVIEEYCLDWDTKHAVIHNILDHIEGNLGYHELPQLEQIILNVWELRLSN